MRPPSPASFVGLTRVKGLPPADPHTGITVSQMRRDGVYKRFSPWARGGLHSESCRPCAATHGKHHGNPLPLSTLSIRSFP